MQKPPRSACVDINKGGVGESQNNFILTNSSVTSPTAQPNCTHFNYNDNDTINSIANVTS